MKALLWATVVVLLVLVFAGDKMRGYFGYESGVAEAPVATEGARNRTEKNKPDKEQPSATGAYVPSPGDAPELYDSPIRRHGF